MRGRNLSELNKTHEDKLFIRFEHNVTQGLSWDSSARFEKEDRFGILLQRSVDHATIVKVEEDLFTIATLKLDIFHKILMK